MDRRRPASVIHSLLALSLILVALSLFMANIVPQDGGPVDVGKSFGSLSAFLSQLLIALALLLIVWAILRAFKNRRNKVPKARGGSGPDVISTLLVVIVIFMVMIALPKAINDSPWLDGGAGEGDDGSSGGQEDPKGVLGLDLVLPLFGLLSTCTVLVLLFFYIRDREPSLMYSSTSRSERSSDREVVQSILSDFSAEKDARKTILSAYRRMVLLRSPDDEAKVMTAHELSEKLIAGLGWPSLPTKTLTHLFEEAKYSLHPMGEEHRASAMESLRIIERWLTQTGRDRDAE